jgi:hypothetical protein
MRYRLMSELKVGDRIKDNDPRVSASRVLRVIEILPNGVLAEHPVSGRVFAILRRRIYTDGKPRRNGFDLIVEQP